MPVEDAGTIGLAPGHLVELPGRGTTLVRQLAGPQPSAPTVVLLHGLGVDADLNWFASYAALAQHYNVVALDHRGHGRGVRTRRFRLVDCADDVAALCAVLGIERVTPIGYSMGGPIAQLLWHRHRDLVQGMVLCATAARFGRAAGRQLASWVIPGLSAVARLAPGTLPSNPIVRQLLAARTNDPAVRQWATQRERRSDPRAVLEAAGCLGRFSSADWLPGVDVPTAVVITQFDRLVPRHRQEELVALIPAATEHRVFGDHGVCVTRPDLFLPKLLEATAAVA